jgi:glutathione S-transferase
MKLYYSPGACSLAPHIIALEAGHTIDLVKVDIPKKKTEHGDDFWKINPKGYVPALQLDSGEVLTEVAVVCQYLADQKPESGLISPFGTLQRYHDMSAINFAATEVHKQIGALFNPALTPEMKEVQKATVARRLKSLNQMLEGKEYVMGDRFMVADAYLFTVLSWTRLHNISLDLYPNIQAYMLHVGGREKVKQAMMEEGLIK